MECKTPKSRVIPMERGMKGQLWIAASVCVALVAPFGAAFVAPFVAASELRETQDTEALSTEWDGATERRVARSRYLAAETVLMGFRQAASDQPMVIRTLDENNQYPGPTLISTDDVVLGFQAGPQITFGVVDDIGDGWETRYFSLLGGGQRAIATGVGNVTLAGDLGLADVNLLDADQMTVDAAGDLHSIEVSRGWNWGGFTMLAAFRYLRLYDRLTITSDAQETDTFSVYDLKTANNLFGGQLGVRSGGDLGRLSWQIDLKAGMYGNAATHNQAVINYADPAAPSFTREWCPRSRGGAAFLGELELALSYALSDRWRARASYRMLWMEGVGLSGDQLTFENVPTADIGLSTAGGVLMYGASIGLERSW